MKRAGLYLIALTGCAMAASTVTAEETMRVQPGLKVLFLDEHAVASSTGLDRSMRQPEKKGAVW